jgi:hypothetical protein
MVKITALIWNPVSLVFDYWSEFTHISTDCQGEGSSPKQSVNFQNILLVLQVMLSNLNWQLLNRATWLFNTVQSAGQPRIATKVLYLPLFKMCLTSNQKLLQQLERCDHWQATRKFYMHGQEPQSGVRHWLNQHTANLMTVLSRFLFQRHISCPFTFIL